MTGTVLILGASGKIGQHSADAFWNAGWQVRHFDRRKDDMVAAAKGVDVIVNGLNPPNYHNWSKLIPAITKQVISAAKSSGATVVIPGNVYNFGKTPGVLTEDTPQRPNTRKGQIRVEMEKTYRDAGVQTIVLRGGNFISPDRNNDIMGLLHLRDIAKGKVTSAGRNDVDQPHCYLPDWATAAVQLAEKRKSLATFEDVPFPGHTFTMNALHKKLEHILVRKLKLVAFPWWLFSALSPFWELAREMKEMRYLWDLPHSLSGEKFERLLPDFVPTDLQTVLTAALPVDVYPNQSVPGSVGIPVL